MTIENIRSAYRSIAKQGKLASEIRCGSKQLFLDFLKRNNVVFRVPSDSTISEYYGVMVREDYTIPSDRAIIQASDGEVLSILKLTKEP